MKDILDESNSYVWARCDLYVEGKCEDAWRNQTAERDGFPDAYWAGGYHFEGDFDAVYAMRTTEYGRQYAAIKGNISKICRMCNGGGTVAGKRRGQRVTCPVCKGHAEMLIESFTIVGEHAKNAN